MRILFATRRRYPPDRHGGAQNSAHALLRRLVRRGHDCEVAAALGPGLRLQFFRLAHLASGRRWMPPAHLHNGYPTRRVAPWQVARLVAARIDAFRPDVVVTDQIEMVDALARERPDLRAPLVLRIADVAFRHHRADLLRRENLHVFANSRFIADALRAFAAIDTPVLYPIVDPEDCRAASHQPHTITFINPIEGKGLETALRVAELLPQHPFLFVSGWPRPTNEEKTLARRLEPLANVQLVPWSRDIRGVYARTRVLLFPARWEEGFGRVILEAHANRIPVVASDRGGLPEAVGSGGHVLPAGAPAFEWAAAVERLMSDDAHYADCARAAGANLRRPEFDPEQITGRFLALLACAVGRDGPTTA